VSGVAYVHEICFDIPREQMTELEIGNSLEKLVGFLKVRLPAERGFVYAHALYSVDDPEKTRIVTRSEWSEWSDLVRHRESEILEDNVFCVFEPHVPREAITVRDYAEVGSGPLAFRR
jgi:hypothetical protein